MGKERGREEKRAGKLKSKSGCKVVKMKFVSQGSMQQEKG